MNPADLHRVESTSNFDGLDGLGGKGLPGSIALAGKNAKIPVAAPRIDTEPIYTALKAAIGENWADYKAALSAFILGGNLNQKELTTVLSPIFTSSSASSSNGAPPGPSVAHLHNTLITSLYANALYRDAPPEPTAPWVLATDAPSSSNKSHATGQSDAIDDRNRREVMALSVRDRRRIKAVKDTPSADGGLTGSKRYHTALDALPSASVHPSLGATGPSAAAAAGKTNTALEIRRRFGLPLASETHELPARDNIAARVEPIAYEEGLGGASGAPAVAELLEVALESYVKALVGGWVGATRAAGPGLVQPAAYRARVRREERLADAGHVGVQRDVLGRLPVEVEALQHREAIAAEDLRLAVRLEGGMRFAPFFGAGWIEEETNREDMVGEEMELDAPEEEWGWHGAGSGERAQLLDVLGELAVS